MSGAGRRLISCSFSSAQDVRGKWIYRFGTGTGRGHARLPADSRACRLPGFRRRSGCVPAEPYPPLKQPMRLQNKSPLAIGAELYSTFARTDLSSFARTTTRKRVLLRKRVLRLGCVCVETGLAVHLRGSHLGAIAPRPPVWQEPG